MKKLLSIALCCAATLSGCSMSGGACEDITLASEQIQSCQLLQRKITEIKDEVLLRTELVRRYQQDCIEMRYYREQQQMAICGNKQKLDDLTNESTEK